jgi:hypothetical protein
MVLLKTKMTKTGIVYIPKEVREAFSRELKILPDARAALFFPAEAAYESVLKSLEVIEFDLKHRIEIEKNEGRSDRE